MDRTKWMFEVAVNKLFVRNGIKERKWVDRAVADVSKEEEFRCSYCGGEVRLHQGKVGKWHAQHIHIEDAIECPGSPAGKVRKVIRRQFS